MNPVPGEKFMSQPMSIPKPSDCSFMVMKPTPEFSSTSADWNNANIPMAPDYEGGQKPMVKNLEELRKENPKLAATVEAEVRAAMNQSYINDVVAAERKRLQEIDEIAGAIDDDELVFEAKYGESACNAQELALRATISAGAKAVKQGNGRS